MNDRLIINLVPGDTYLHKLSGASKTRMFAVLIVVLLVKPTGILGKVRREKV